MKAKKKKLTAVTLSAFLALVGTVRAQCTGGDKKLESGNKNHKYHKSGKKGHKHKHKHRYSGKKSTKISSAPK